MISSNNSSHNFLFQKINRLILDHFKVLGWVLWQEPTWQTDTQTGRQASKKQTDKQTDTDHGLTQIWSSLEENCPCSFLFEYCYLYGKIRYYIQLRSNMTKFQALRWMVRPSFLFCFDDEVNPQQMSKIHKNQSI